MPIVLLLPCQKPQNPDNVTFTRYNLAADGPKVYGIVQFRTQKRTIYSWNVASGTVGPFLAEMNMIPDITGVGHEQRYLCTKAGSFQGSIASL
ncbi:MAG TPA: hypothetical protein DCP28_10715 [Cytophagales bacterium]|nr:hypothetical protein [Cytophagales bacterium]